MNRRNKLVVRQVGLLGYLAIILIMVACAAGGTAITPVSTQAAPLRLDNNVVEVRDEKGDWTPVGGEATFELVGKLESTNPWKVTGNTFATRASTQIAEGLKVGDLVRVKGFILGDGTWLATSIEPAEKETDATIILIGKVNSMDPWVVNGIKLNVTSDTVIGGDIKPGMFVRVEILLSPDGTWEVVNIAPLSNFTEIPGCTTIMARITSVNGNEIQFVGWPAVTLDKDVNVENDGGGSGTLRANQSVLVVVCTSKGGQITITRIIILITTNDEGSGNGGKVLICHKPDKKGGHTLSVASAALPAHLAHGDTLGPCH